jgi:hypothetical protein
MGLGFAHVFRVIDPIAAGRIQDHRAQARGVASAQIVPHNVEMICDPLPRGYRGEQTFDTGRKDLRAMTKIGRFGLRLFDQRFQFDDIAYQVPASGARGGCVRTDRECVGHSGHRLLRRVNLTMGPMITLEEF